MRLKFFKSLSVLMSLILFISVINFPTLIAKADSGSGVEGFVERCYTVILGRPSEPGGLAYWTDALKKGERVGTNVAYGFVFSDEYANRNRTNEEFVNDMYSLVLDREADAGGYEYWCTKLENGETRQQVYGGFVNSPEFYGICQQYGITAGYFLAEYDYMQVNNVNLFVDRLYRTCLGRPGDQGGQEYWVRALINNEITGINCAAGFVNSIEYRNNGLSNEDYVENMYSACLGRQSEPNGKAYWVNALVNGMTRDELFAGFANSEELNNICAEYGIIRGDYTPTDIGTFDPNKNNSDNPDKPNFKVGDTVVFGKYEQDGNTSNGKEDIEWQILKVEDGRILVISKYALDCQIYDTEWTIDTMAWDICGLREWLNNDFYNTAFSDKEKSNIPSVTLVNKDNPYYGSLGGTDTTDKVFCLSLEEMETYFGNYQSYSSTYLDGYNQNLICTPTQYAINKGVYYYDITEEKYYKGGWWNPATDSRDLALSDIYTSDVIGRRGCYWWLRSPGYNSGYACFVRADGLVGADLDYRVDRSDVAVRPAMYIEY